MSLLETGDGRPLHFYLLAKSALLFCGLLGALILFGLMAEDVVEGDLIGFDRPLLIWLHSGSSAWLDSAMRIITTLGSVWTVVPVLMLAMLAYRRDRPAMLYLLAANAGSALLNLAAKHGFERIRPTYWTPLVHETSYSFPSGHAMQTMALVTSLWLVRRHIARPWPMLVLGGCYVFLVGTSRLYLGVHYPSDVLGGWCAAVIWCYGLALALGRDA